MTNRQRVLKRYPCATIERHGEAYFITGPCAAITCAERTAGAAWRAAWQATCYRSQNSCFRIYGSMEDVEERRRYASHENKKRAALLRFLGSLPRDEVDSMVNQAKLLIEVADRLPSR